MVYDEVLLIDEHWINQFVDYRKLYIGFSGGVDSTALLHALASQSAVFSKLHAVHVNHGLNALAVQWEHHCQAVCDALGVPLSIHRVDILKPSNLEEQARLARYGVFNELLTSDDGLVLAHHEDDQAETLLLHLMRGAGVDGLAAMEPIKPLVEGVILRPLLTCSRQRIESYARFHQLSWIEDDSNNNLCFSRNFLRHQIIPLLNEKWPAATQNIARAAVHCREAKKNLDTLANLDCFELTTHSNCLSIGKLKCLPRERMMNVLRVWLKKNNPYLPSAKIMNGIIDDVIYSREDSVPEVTFGENVIRRFQEKLFYQKLSSMSLETITWSTFPAPLKVNENTMYASMSKSGFCPPAGGCIQVRFRQGGELFRWHGQTKSLKKLFQQWTIPPWVRDSIPLIFVNDELAVVVGYAVSDHFYNAQALSFKIGLGSTFALHYHAIGLKTREKLWRNP